jgi:hypothetical protein
MNLEERVTRLEKIVIHLQYLTLLHGDFFKGKDEKSSISELSSLVEQIAREHGLQVDAE